MFALRCSDEPVSVGGQQEARFTLSRTSRGRQRVPCAGKLRGLPGRGTPDRGEEDAKAEQGRPLAPGQGLPLWSEPWVQREGLPRLPKAVTPTTWAVGSWAGLRATTLDVGWPFSTLKHPPTLNVLPALPKSSHSLLLWVHFNSKGSGGKLHTHTQTHTRLRAQRTLEMV